LSLPFRESKYTLTLRRIDDSREVDFHPANNSKTEIARTSNAQALYNRPWYRPIAIDSAKSRARQEGGLDGCLRWMTRVRRSVGAATEDY
jgi:hypothetical protein